MHSSRLNRFRARRGGILLATLVLAGVVATLLAGLGVLLVSFYSRATDEASYASAINLADGGVNYELAMINRSVNNADMPGTGSTPGNTHSLGNGTVTVYCTMMDGVTSWDKSTMPFQITSTGTVGGVSRTVRTTTGGSSPLVPNSSPGTGMAIFAVNGFTNTGPCSIIGDLGTDGTGNVSGTLSVGGDITFYGSGAGWVSGSKTNYTYASNATAITWPTSAQMALSQFPNSGATAPGGYTYLLIHNDNTLALPAIVGSLINLSSGNITLKGKAGGANYYLTSLSMSGPSTLTFDNSAGPITVWVGPVEGGGTFKLSGGSAVVKNDPTKLVRFIIATTKGVSLTGSSELDAGVYNVTGGAALTSLTGTGQIVGQVIGDTLSMTGGSNITAAGVSSGYFSPNYTAPYKFSSGWQELNILQ